MSAAAYSIPKQSHASERYSCQHENVSVYRSAHILIIDHIRHTDRHTKGSTDMKIDARTAVADVYINEWLDGIIVETWDGTQQRWLVKGGVDNVEPIYDRLHKALENTDAKAWREAHRELLVDVEF